MYGALNCCDGTLGIDKLLKHYENERTAAINSLNNHTVSENSLFAVDSNCTWKMGRVSGLGTLRSSYHCAQCKNLSRLVDLSKFVLNTPVLIKNGREAGRYWNVSASPVNSLFLENDPHAENKMSVYIENYKSLTSCGTPDTALNCIKGDSFTISTLIQWYLHDYFFKKGLPHIPLLYTAFVCDKMGYKVEECHQEFDLNSLTPEIVKGILLQILVIFKELAALNFNHGTPTLESLLFLNKPVSYMYEGIRVVCPMTVALTNFTHSSLTINGSHYFVENTLHPVYLAHGIFAPEISTFRCNECSCGSLFYRLSNNKKHETLTAIRHIGFPLFTGSYDVYNLILSLMGDRDIYNEVIRDDFLFNFWCALWHAKDVNTITQTIERNHNRGTSMDRYVVMHSGWLRCNIIDHLLKLYQ
jgi:hypothetical protein